MARGDQLSRQWRLVQLLTDKIGRTLDQLRAELGVNKRTVQRDISDLERAGFPVLSEMYEGTVRWRFIEGFCPHSAVSFTLPELMALYFSKGLFRPLQGMPVYDALQSAIQKIGTSLPAAGHSLLSNLHQGISISTFGAKDYTRSRDVIDKLTKAVFHHQTCEIQHAAGGHENALSRTVNPYKLWYADNGLYLVGYDHWKEDIRVFAVERIESVAITNRRFEVPTDFNFEDFTRTAFRLIWGEPQTVKIRFSPEQALFVAERTWHPSQKITFEEDGSVTLELSVADLGEVKRWLLGWGAAAKVLEPQQLRNEIKTECRSMLKTYGAQQIRRMRPN